MPRFSQSSKDKLATCDPRLQDIANEAIEIIDFKVDCGHRGQVDQDAAFAAGKSKKRWPNGNHNAIPSRAMDLLPLANRKLDWDDLILFGRLMGIIQAIAYRRGIRLRFGCDWDGDMRSVYKDPDEAFQDCPHVELVDP